MVARFLNSSVVLLFVYNDPKNWFKRGDLVYDATLLILIESVMPLYNAVVNSGKRIKQAKIWFHRKNGDDKC